MLDIKYIKKGVKIECLKDCYEYFTKGKVYTCSQDVLSRFGGVRVTEDDRGRENGWLINNFKLHEPKQDLRELLQVGQKISNEYQTEFIGDEIHLRDLKSRFNENLYSGLSKTTIDEIYRKKYNGIKPMEWALVWKREEERFTLRLAGNVRLPYYAHGNCKTRYDYTFRKSSKPVNEEKYQVAFTEAEIKNIPNQELINGLIKEPVKNETV